MADILSPTGIEKPLGGELHSRAQYLRNLDRINQVAIDSIKQPIGRIYFNRVATNSGTFSAITVVSSIATFTFKGGRRYRIVWDTDWIGTVANTVAAFRIDLCSVADAAAATTGLTQLGIRDAHSLAAGVSAPAYITAYYDPTVDTTTQVKFLAQTDGSGTTLFVQGNRAGGSVYAIYDDGAP